MALCSAAVRDIVVVLWALADCPCSRCACYHLTTHTQRDGNNQKYNLQACHSIERQ